MQYLLKATPRYRNDLRACSRIRSSAVTALRGMPSNSADLRFPFGANDRPCARRPEGGKPRDCTRDGSDLETKVRLHIRDRVRICGVGQKEDVFLWLGKALSEHCASMPWLKVEPWLDNLRSDSRYFDLLKKIAIATAQTPMSK